MKTLLERYPMLDVCKDNIAAVVSLMINSFRTGGKLLVCGNGGSCADSDHIVGELMKGFLLRRGVPTEMKEKLTTLFPEQGGEIAGSLQGALPAISLPSQTAVLSAYINDVRADMMYAQLVYGYGRPGDVFLGITTSGNSENVVNAAMTAKAFGLRTIGLTGKSVCRLDEIADTVIHVPETETYKVQELHLPVYHYLCAECERELFTGEK